MVSFVEIFVSSLPAQSQGCMKPELQSGLHEASFCRMNHTMLYFCSPTSLLVPAGGMLVLGRAASIMSVKHWDSHALLGQCFVLPGARGMGEVRTEGKTSCFALSESPSVHRSTRTRCKGLYEHVSLEMQRHATYFLCPSSSSLNLACSALQ